jgi:hypothetical protein
MSKRLSSTILLFLVVIGFTIASVTMFVESKGAGDMIVQACLYLIPAIAAAGALIMLPFKQQQ